MQQGERLAVRGLLRLKANSMEHKLKLRTNTRREDKSMKTLMEQAKEHYTNKLKYPIRLRNDPEWHAEKAYRRKLRQYHAGRLQVQYFEHANNHIYLEGCDIPLAKSQPLNEEEHDDTFDNFNRKKFVELPTNRFYEETLECSFHVGQTHRNIRTEPSKHSYTKKVMITNESKQQQSQASPSVQLRKNFRSFVDEKTRLFGVQRGRSVTSAFLNNMVRERRFTKLSKGSDRTKIESVMKMEQVQLEFAQSISQLRLLTSTPEGAISKKSVIDKLIERYGSQLSHLPLRCYRRDLNLHLKATLESFNQWNSTKINKMVFDYYDFNKNGLLDEEDLLQMLKRSENVKAIEQDYYSLQLYLGRFDNKVRDPLSPSRSNLSLAKRVSRLSRISMATATEDDSRLISEQPSTQSRNQQSPQLWTLVEEGINESVTKLKPKKPLSPANTGDTSKQICISLDRFQQIYRLHRPQLYYDLMCYLFGYVRPEPTKNRFRKKPITLQQSGKTPRESITLSQNTIELIRHKLQNLRMESIRPAARR